MPNTVLPPKSAVHPPDKTRRRFPRRSKPFQGVYYAQSGQRVPMVGLDISGGGICMLLQNPIPDPMQDLTLGVVIGDKPLAVIGRVRWSNVYKVKDVAHYRYGIKLNRIPDTDWERLMHMILESGGGGAREGEQLSEAQRDELLGEEAQRKIAEALVEKDRLDPPGAGRIPRIDYTFEKYTMRLGTAYMAFKVHTRYSNRYTRKIEDHDTRILVGCEDDRVKVLD